MLIFLYPITSLEASHGVDKMSSSGQHMSKSMLSHAGRGCSSGKTGELGGGLEDPWRKQLSLHKAEGGDNGCWHRNWFQVNMEEARYCCTLLFPQSPFSLLPMYTWRGECGSCHHSYFSRDLNDGKQSHHSLWPLLPHFWSWWQCRNELGSKIHPIICSNVCCLKHGVGSV